MPTEQISVTFSREQWNLIRCALILHAVDARQTDSEGYAEQVFAAYHALCDVVPPVV